MISLFRIIIIYFFFLFFTFSYSLTHDSFILYDKFFSPPNKNNKSRYIASCLILTDENTENLSEWIEYHYRVGIDKFYLFDTSSTNNILSDIQLYIKNGIASYQYYGKKVKNLENLDENVGENSNNIPSYFSSSLFSSTSQPSSTASAHTSSALEVEIYNKCLSMYGVYHQFMIILNTNEFLLLENDSTSSSNFLFNKKGDIILSSSTYNLSSYEDNSIYEGFGIEKYNQKIKKPLPLHEFLSKFVLYGAVEIKHQRLLPIKNFNSLPNLPLEYINNKKLKEYDIPTINTDIYYYKLLDYIYYYKNSKRISLIFNTGGIKKILSTNSAIYYSSYKVFSLSSSDLSHLHGSSSFSSSSSSSSSSSIENRSKKYRVDEEYYDDNITKENENDFDKKVTLKIYRMDSIVKEFKWRKLTSLSPRISISPTISTDHSLSTSRYLRERNDDPDNTIFCTLTLPNVDPSRIIKNSF